MKQVLHVEGMSCEHCVASIEKALQEKGVKADVDLKAGTVEVDVPEGKVSLEEIRDEIEELGYDVRS